jgi:DNA processing protein
MTTRPVVASGVGAEARARVALSRLAEPGDVALGRRVAAEGAPAVLRRIETGSLDSARLSHYRARLDRLDVDLDLEVAARSGIRLLIPGDDEWPASLGDLGPAEPLVLWVSGEVGLAATTGRSVAVVGARACTAYGGHVAAELAAGLADRGWTVVSGGAFGVDAAAHRGALAVDGATVAVLACGADMVYPAAHEGLLAAVRRRGVVVSELPPGARPTRSRFLERNRLIAALGRGTVVVEAAIRSGARTTASRADELSRPVMAVPGPVTSAMSAGCHLLIRERGASLVTDAADVVDLVGELGVDAAEERRGETRPEDGLDPMTLRVLEALPLRRWARPDAVGVVAGVDAPTVLRGLALLAGAGLAESRNGAWRRAPSAKTTAGPP